MNGGRYTEAASPVLISNSTPFASPASGLRGAPVNRKTCAFLNSNVRNPLSCSRVRPAQAIELQLGQNFLGVGRRVWIQRLLDAYRREVEVVVKNFGAVMGPSCGKPTLESSVSISPSNSGARRSSLSSHGNTHRSLAFGMQAFI